VATIGRHVELERTDTAFLPPAALLVEYEQPHARLVHCPLVLLARQAVLFGEMQLGLLDNLAAVLEDIAKRDCGSR
jgi:hypothetical protein